MKNETKDIIHCYEYKPEPKFQGNNKRYLGVELEVDSGGCCNSNAKGVLNILGNDYVYAKHDSTLSNGFEIISHPCTLDFHSKNINWNKGLKQLSNMGYKSHYTNTCAIHIHMNKEGFGSTHEQQDLAIAKILYFTERHWNNIVRFSRRTPNQLEEWASRYLDNEEQPSHPSDEFLINYAKNDGSRYRAINLCNDKTIEIRIFRGTLKYSSFMAILQFCNILYDIAKMDLIDAIKITWNDFISMGSKYEEFTIYINERNLAS